MATTLEARTDRQLHLIFDRTQAIANLAEEVMEVMAKRGAAPDDLFMFAERIAGTLAVPLAVLERRAHP